MLSHGTVRKRREGDAVTGPPAVRALSVSLEHHAALVQAPIQLEEQPLIVDPRLMPALGEAIVDVETPTPRAAGTNPALSQHAAAEHALDGVTAHLLPERVEDDPLTDPEVELPELGLRTGGGGQRARRRR